MGWFISARGFNVYALNASTGAKLWSYATGVYVQSAPTVANGVVYISSDKLYALNASTGALLWSYEAGGLTRSGERGGLCRAAAPTCVR